jgi:hypothetical protein
VGWSGLGWLWLIVGGCGFSVQASVTDPGVDAAAIDAGWPAGAPVAYWSFDIDARDASGAHNGVLKGNAVITSGFRGVGGGEALQLGADGDRVELGNATTFNFNADFTWHAYIKTTSTDGAIFSRNPAGTAWNQGSKALFVRNGTVQWDTGWVGNPGTNASVKDGAWHQVIATYRAAGDTFNVFVDPVPGATTGRFTGVHDINLFDEHTHLHNGGLAESGFSIAQANFSGGLTSLNTLIGLVDEAAIFDRALVGAELDQLIRGGPVSFVRP